MLRIMLIGLFVVFSAFFCGCKPPEAKIETKMEIKPHKSEISATSFEKWRDIIELPREKKHEIARQFAEGNLDAIPATRLYRTYSANEVAADVLYKSDMPIFIDGIVDYIGKDILADPYIILKTDDWGGMVQCMFWKEDVSELVSIYPGQRIIVAGVCSGKMFTNVILRDCLIIKKDSPQSHKKSLKKIRHRKHPK
jgi:hypothetical protein